jgi:glucose-6-phosphate 1-dehydrogenase
VTDPALLDLNPLRAGLRLRRTPEPLTVVIMGVTGDLAQRKLFPSLYRLHRDGHLPAGFSIVGVARRPWDDDAFRGFIRANLEEFLGEPLQDQVWLAFSEGLFFSAGEFGDLGTYHDLRDVVARLDRGRVRTGNRLVYLAAPPSTYLEIIAGLGQAGLAATRVQSAEASRIVVEKPFGHDLASAKELNEQLRQWFREDQIFRIDHYLGKETVQNILVFRLANSIFEPVWNEQYVDHVQITVAEDLGVAGREAYYEEAGAIRDIIQNHGLQLLALVAMEPPVTFDATGVRDEKVKVLRGLRLLEGAEADRSVVRGRYTAGLLQGKPVLGYREEEGVAPDSLTETYVAMRVFVDTWRWAGVPFYLRSGKRLSKRVTEIAIEFKRPPLVLFGREAVEEFEPNVLVVHVQPDEGITLRFGSKVPGPTIRIHDVTMDFRYGTSFGVQPADAYERLLLDAFLGDSTLFTRDDGVEAAWRFVDPIIGSWRRPDAPEPEGYEAGGWGPEGADELLLRDGREWRRL